MEKTSRSSRDNSVLSCTSRLLVRRGRTFSTKDVGKGPVGRNSQVGDHSLKIMRHTVVAITTKTSLGFLFKSVLQLCNTCPSSGYIDDTG